MKLFEKDLHVKLPKLYQDRLNQLCRKKDYKSKSKTDIVLELLDQSVSMVLDIEAIHGEREIEEEKTIHVKRKIKEKVDVEKTRLHQRLQNMQIELDGRHIVLGEKKKEIANLNEQLREKDQAVKMFGSIEFEKLILEKELGLLREEFKHYKNYADRIRIPCKKKGLAEYMKDCPSCDLQFECPSYAEVSMNNRLPQSIEVVSES